MSLPSTFVFVDDGSHSAPSPMGGLAAVCTWRPIVDSWFQARVARDVSPMGGLAAVVCTSKPVPGVGTAMATGARRVRALAIMITLACMMIQLRRWQETIMPGDRQAGTTFWPMLRRLHLVYLYMYI